METEFYTIKYCDRWKQVPSHLLLCSIRFLDDNRSTTNGTVFFSSHSLNTKISNISNLIKSICSCRLFFFFIQNELFNTHTQLKWNELTVTKCMFTKV